MSTPDQYHVSPLYGPKMANANAGKAYQQQQVWPWPWQQEQLHVSGQGRGSSHDQPSYYQPDYQRKYYLSPVNIENYQPRLPQQDYNVAGTNAAPMQRQFSPGEYSYGKNSGPTSLDSSITKSRSVADYTGKPSPDPSPLAATRRAEQPT